MAAPSVFSSSLLVVHGFYALFTYIPYFTYNRSANAGVLPNVFIEIENVF